MTRVVARCPTCGVEHDDARGGACEVCGTPLRFWCREHSREIGWLDSASCPRCAAATVRPGPTPPTPAPPAPARPHPPRPSRVEAPAPARRTEPRPTTEALAPYPAVAVVAGRLVRAVGALAGWAVVCAVLGAVAGFAFPDLLVVGGAAAEPVWTAMAGAMLGGGAGVVVGAIRAIRILFAVEGPPDG